MLWTAPDTNNEELINEELTTTFLAYVIARKREVGCKLTPVIGDMVSVIYCKNTGEVDTVVVGEVICLDVESCTLLPQGILGAIHDHEPGYNWTTGDPLVVDVDKIIKIVVSLVVAN